jgi:hypothetical protein
MRERWSSFWRWWWGLHRLEQVAVWVWLILVVAVSVRVSLASQRSHTVYPIYEQAAQHWRAGADCYLPVPGLDLFRNTPIVAAGFVPFSLLPYKTAGVVWRLIGVVVFLIALADWAKVVLPQALSPARRGLLFAMVMPVALNSYNNGQLNMLLTGVLMLSASTAIRGRWTACAIYMTIATLLKIYPLAFGLLLVVIEPRRFGPRLAAALAVGFALPFLFQNPAYVLDQYGSWFGLMGADDRLLGPWERCPRDLYLLFRYWGEPPSLEMYKLWQLAGAAGCAAVCLLARRRWGGGTATVALAYHLAMIWMLILGPATESCTYTLLAPSFVGAILAPPPGRKWGLTILPVVGYGLLVATILAGMFPQDWRVQILGPQPFAALLLLTALLVEAATRPRPAAAPEGKSDAPQRQAA